MDLKLELFIKIVVSGFFTKNNSKLQRDTIILLIILQMLHILGILLNQKLSGTGLEDSLIGGSVENPLKLIKDCQVLKDNGLIFYYFKFIFLILLIF